MKYMGSKARFAKEIVPILNSFFCNERRYYVEPFVGGANIIDKVDFEFRKGYDKNPYLIDLLKHVQKGREIPITITEKEYYEVRDNKDNYPNWYVGLIGFCASYGGRFFEGYPRGNNADGTPRDYTNEAIRNLEKQRIHLNGIIFDSCDYSEVDCRKIDALVYCDPPYRSSKPYKVDLLGNFDNDKFWQWVRTQSAINPVVVSEYEAPDDFLCIWVKNGVTSNLIGKGTKVSSERLFIENKWAEIRDFNQAQFNIFQDINSYD